MALRMLPPEQRTPQRAAALQMAMQDALRTGRSAFFAKPIEAELWRHPDGPKRFFQQTVYPLTTEAGLCLATLTQDITERKAAEAQLRVSEAQYRALVEQASDGIFIADAQGRYLDVNPSGCAMLGYSREELIGQDYHLILSPDQSAQVPSSLAVLREGQTVVRERIYRRKDGTLFPIETSARRLSDGRVQSFVRDISERKRAEEALRAGEARFRAVVEHGFDALVLLAADGTTLDVNPAYERLTGYAAAERVGRPAGELAHPDDRSTVQRALRSLLRGPGAEATLQFRLVRKGGDVRWVEVSAHNLLQQPAVRAVVINARDITERHVAEQSLQRRADEFGAL
jgi:PAS domain S-box-containing protein